ncbi:MAG: orotate phosphoribosyltransferase, partial [Clostridia bacterium]|nr:orotate phosphoribosyltransferase [Clostridia bacterium]
MEKKIAKRLLEIKAVFLSPNEPFTWASGIKSPIYCDNRLTLSYPEIRTEIETGIAEVVKAKYPECQALAGTSTAGIAHAAIAAH